MERKPLDTERPGFIKRFALPLKRNEGLAPEIKDGLLFMKQLAQQKVSAGGLSDATLLSVHTAISWIENLTAPTPEVELMKIYFNVGLYPDGTPGEVFIKADRSGSLASGALDAVAMLISIGLQHGINLHTLIEKLRNTHFEPFGYTRDPDFPSASSPLDLLAKWLTKKFPQEP